MPTAVERWNKTKDYVSKLNGVNQQQLAVFKNSCGEMETDLELISDALKIPFARHDKTKRYALRSLELLTILNDILAKRLTPGKDEYKRIAKEVRKAHDEKAESALQAEIIKLLGKLPLVVSASEIQVYIEDRDQGRIDKLSVDLPFPGSLSVKTESDEKTMVKRLPNQCYRGPCVQYIPKGGLGVLPYLGEGNQDLIVFDVDKIRGSWTNDISYCVPVVFFYGLFPEYSAITFTHLPGGDVSKCNWDWMFLQNLPSGRTLPPLPAAPDKVLIAYNPTMVDASTLECIDVILQRGVPRHKITVYGFIHNVDFAVDKFGFFGMMAVKPTKYSRYDSYPNFFRLG